MTRIFFFLLSFLLLVVNVWAETCSVTRWYFNRSECSQNSDYTYNCNYSVSGYTGGATCSNSQATVTLVGSGGSGTIKSCTIYYVSQTVEVNVNVCQRDSTDALCDDARSQCESAGGTFSGSGNSGCCIGTCSQCGKLKELVQQKAAICCSRGMAPPDTVQACYVVAPSTCGVNWSEFKSSDNEFSCQSPSLGGAAAQRYVDQCFDHSSSSNTNSSSSGGNSSSGGGSSGSGECQECPYLEAILDTLTKQKHTVDDIYSCLTVPGLCGQEENDSLEIPEWVRDKLDSIKKVDSLILIATKSSDSVLKEISNFAPSILQSDSITREEIKEGLKTLDTSVRSINDTTAHYLTHVANVIGASENELSAHLDSIISHIPDSVLDSILKYQKYSIDNFDSLGDGFAKIDALTDSAIKYFKEGYRFDSIYNNQYRDSLGAIHGAIENLSGSIEGVGDKILYGLGYGDTASSTLRDDLRGYLTGTAVDTHGVNYGSNWVANGERMGDSIVNSLGWGGIRNINIDSVYSHALDGSRMDSVSQSIDDSLSGVAANLNDSLAARTDSLKRQLPTVLDSMADSLVIWAPFADFDSIIYSTIGAHIPNRSDCPEDCQKWTVSIPIIGLYSYTVDFGLCLGRATFGGLSVLGFLKLLIRVIVAYACIMTAYKVLVRMI